MVAFCSHVLPCTVRLNLFSSVVKNLICIFYVSHLVTLLIVMYVVCIFQGIVTMTYTRSHTRPSQKDWGCVVYPLNNKSLGYGAIFFCCMLTFTFKKTVTSIQLQNKQVDFMQDTPHHATLKRK